MNDRYLFKAKRNNWRELPKEDWWVQGCYWTNGLGNHFIKVYQDSKGYFVLEDIEVDESTLCQCTGLKDKNGTLIWENDVVRCGRKMLVSWNVKFSSWCLTRKGWLCSHFFGESQESEECEVVGNSIDNPELLEVG